MPKKVFDINLNKYVEEVRDYGEMKNSLDVTGITVTLNIPPDSYSGYRINPFADKLDKNYPKTSDEKRVPDNLDVMINSKEKVGAVLYVIEKHLPTNTWRITYKTNKFFLTGLTMGLKEKVQIMETFGSAVISFFGSSVKVYEFTGVTMEAPSSQTGYQPYDFSLGEKANSNVLIRSNGSVEDLAEPREEVLSKSTSNAFWQSSLIHMYENVLRGTQLVKNNSVALMTVGTHYIYGYPINLSSMYSAQFDKIANFSMAWVVLDHVMAYDDLENDDFAKNYIPLETSISEVGATTIDAPLMVPSQLQTIRNEGNLHEFKRNRT